MEREIFDLAANEVHKAEIRMRMESARKAEACFYEMISGGFFAENSRMSDLVHAFDDLRAEKRLFIEGAVISDNFRVSVVEGDCFECAGVVGVGPGFVEDLGVKPEGARAELLYNMARAAFVEAGVENVGCFKTIGEVREVLGEYLKLVPRERLSESQLKLIDGQKRA